MSAPLRKKQSGLAGRLAVVLVRPESPENVGLAARAMKNTGFSRLRVVGADALDRGAWRTAVHAEDVLSACLFFPTLEAAVADLNVVFGSTARRRQNFSAIGLEGAVSKLRAFAPPAAVGLVFGNERTGLTSSEIGLTNFRFTIPQAARQPSYNLASAVLLTLFEIFRQDAAPSRERAAGPDEVPLPFAEQRECLRLILRKLEDRRFIHAGNVRHVTEMISDLVGRLAITARDRSLLLAMFSHAGVEPERRA